MSALREYLEEALDDLADLQDSWMFGGISFPGVANELRPDDPRVAGSTDRHFELKIKTRLFRYPWPKRGDEGTCGSVTHRIVRADHDTILGISTIIVVQSSAIEPTGQEQEGSAFSSAFSAGFFSDYSNGFDPAFSTGFA